MLSVSRLRRAVFARHCHPCSAWTRWASTPLTLVPIWTRRPGHGVLLVLWLAVNPFVFGKPQHRRAWATRAMLGEELWISHPPLDAALLVSVFTTEAAAAAVIAARRRRLRPAVIAVTAQMVLTMVYWQLMVRYFDSQDQAK